MTPTPSAEKLNSASCVVLDDELHFTGHGDLGALRATNQASLELVELDLEVAGNGRQDLGVAAGCCDLEGLGALALGLDVDELTRLHAEGRACLLYTSDAADEA